MTQTQNSINRPAGTALLDFGAFPGKSDASLAITGQGAIQTTSVVIVHLQPAATADHSSDEHIVETLQVMAGNIVAGTGFTIYGANTNQISEAPLVPNDGNGGVRLGGGRGTRIYGKWNIAWYWL